MTRIELIYYILFCGIIHLGSGYKILLVFPLPGTSHSILGEAFVKTLLKAGHEVTYITPIPIKSPSEQLHQIDVSTNYEYLPTEDIFNIQKIISKQIDVNDLAMLFDMMNRISNGTLMHENVQRLMHDSSEQFDAVIVEWMYNELYSGFGTVFNCPLIWSSSMDIHFLVSSLIDEDLNPTYSADISSSETPPYTFLQRVDKLLSYIDTRFKKWWFSYLESDIYEKAFKTAVIKRGHKYIPLDEARYTGSLMFGNSHLSIGQAIRLPVNYIPIGGYHIDPDVKPLPTELQKIMDDSNHGVIYFSMGSVLKSKHIPDDLKMAILNVFAELKQTVIWKFEEKLPNLPKNVHIVHWSPQQSVLAHPNCVLFITHGGLLSTTEAVHYGVPTIGIPMFADQFVNVNRAVKKGFAIRIDLDYKTPVNLKAAIENILENPRYRDTVKELSFVYHHRPVSPRTLLVHWVEHVVRTRGGPHIRSPALQLSWIQKFYIDFIIAVLVVLFFIVYTIKKILGCKKNKQIILKKKSK